MHRKNLMTGLNQKGFTVVLAFAAALCLSLMPASVEASSVPRWMRAAILQKVQPYSSDVPYVVLLDEAVTTVRKNGKAETRYRYVVKLLTAEGRAASKREIYYDKETTIGRNDGWLLQASGKIERLRKESIQDQSVSDDLYSDSRTRTLQFNDAEVGSVMAFEWVQEQRPLINQQCHFFQERAPVVLSLYSLKLPSDWRVESYIFDHEPVEPKVEGNVYTWELTDLPPIEREPMMPAITSVAPYIGVSYFPSHGSVAKKSFSSWSDVSSWAAQQMDRQSSTPDQSIQKKVQSLTAGLQTEPARVRALSDWVQKEVRYVSIQLGAKSGYHPHPASLVLKKGYGDCKDKAALLKTMLDSIGVKSNITLVCSGDPTRVQPAFPSILQFNHAILEIDGVHGLSTPQSGIGAGSLFFDPSDVGTPLGGIPYYLQGSYGLVVSDKGGELVRLPSDTEQSNFIHRDATLTLDDEGGVSGRIQISLTGQPAAIASGGAPTDGLLSGSAFDISKNIPGAMIKPLETQPSSQNGTRISAYSLVAPAFASLSGKIIVAKPLSLWPWGFPQFVDDSRREAVIFPMKFVQQDQITIKIPDGLKLDEYPRNVELQTDFGQFLLTYETTDDSITISRRLIISSETIQPSDYNALRNLFSTAARASNSGIVLLKK